MNKALTFLAIAGLSFANDELIISADNDLFGQTVARSVAQAGGRWVTKKITEALIKRLDDEDLKLLAGEDLELLAGEDLELLAGEDLELFVGEENIDDDAFAFKDKLKGAIKKGANFVANNPQIVTKAAQFLAKRLNDNTEEDELIYRPFVHTLPIIRPTLRMAAGEDELNVKDKVKDVIKKGAQFIANNPQVITKGAQVVANHPETIKKVAQFIANRADDNTEEDELIYRPFVHTLPIIRPTLRMAVGEDEELAIKDKIRTGIRKGAEAIAKNPKAVTKVANFIAKRVDDEFIAMNGETVFIGF